ncbi:MAG: hypothetical protein WCA35_00885 [Kovacikia sp.]
MRWDTNSIEMGYQSFDPDDTTFDRIYPQTVSVEECHLCQAMVRSPIQQCQFR